MSSTHVLPSTARPAHPSARPAASHAPRPAYRSQKGYTLAHDGRQVRIGPVAFWIVVGTLVVMAIWSIATGSYFAFKENVLTRLIGRQAQMQFAYEDRIAELRAQIDRVTSRQLLDQEQFEQRLEGLLRRQATLEARSAALGGGSPPKAGRGKAQPQKPLPLGDNDSVPTPGRRSDLETNSNVAANRPSGRLDALMSRVSQSLDRVEQKQDYALGHTEQSLEARLNHMRSVIAGLGVSLGKHGDDITGSIGGPFVPLRRPSKTATPFEQQLYRVKVTRAELDDMTREMNEIPLRKPVQGEIDMTSPFGVRMDPFLGEPAIHTGIDLRGQIGEPARATADGTVTIASRAGGYGNMVEINHHNGVSTRYGHLSKILVKVGQQVHIGQVVGLIGSTGRSTGPHLHYETRINNTAVDPQKFLHAGAKLYGID
jgi:murein DD-endopeptidase MepM/ murein hydrolase activator NlpD